MIKSRPFTCLLNETHFLLHRDKKRVGNPHGRVLAYKSVKKTEEVAGWGPSSRCQGVLAYNSSFWNFLRLQVWFVGSAWVIIDNVGMKFTTMY